MRSTCKILNREVGLDEINQAQLSESDYKFTRSDMMRILSAIRDYYTMEIDYLAFRSVYESHPEYDSWDKLRSMDLNEKLTKIIYKLYPDHMFFHNDEIPDGEWITKQGKFPKRFARLIKDRLGIKLDNRAMGSIGELAQKIIEYNLKQETGYFDLTSTLDWSRGSFGDEGSCFWSDRSSARDTLEYYGSLAIRFYSEYQPYSEVFGIGRAWIITKYPDKIILLNAYGPYNLETIFKYLRSFWRSRFGIELYGNRIDLLNYGDTCGYLYINSGSGYLISEDPEISGIQIIDLEFDQKSGEYAHHRSINCYNCGDIINPDDSIFHEDEHYCERCYAEIFITCYRCNYTLWRDDTIESRSGRLYCRACYDIRFFRCGGCDEETHVNYRFEFSGDQFCESCFEDLTAECQICNERHFREDLIAECQICNELHSREDLISGSDIWICSNCSRNIESEDLL